MEPMLPLVRVGRTIVVVKMEIIGHILTNTITDGGLGANVLPKESWKALGKLILCAPTFHLVGANEHGIKPLGTLMVQKVTVGTPQYFHDFVVITLEKGGYNTPVDRGWPITTKANHNWKKNTLSIESKVPGSLD